jgi:hypothetical protein
VTGSTVEIADEMAIGKLGIRQRWQTKRGFPGRERIIDWITLDIEGSFFPEQERDNFGEVAGLLNYDFRWHVGDRLTVLSDGYADLFPDGLKTASIGCVLSRPGRSRLYVGYRSVNGPFSSDLVNAAVEYRMSEIWALKAGGMVDLGATGNIGEHFSITRIGESILLRVGASVNHSRDNYGLNFSIEPRFLAGKLNQIAGRPLPPPGFFGVE